MFHDSALAVVLAIAGAGAILYAVIYERLKSFGPKGLELFEATKRRLAERLERGLSDRLRISDSASATVTRADTLADGIRTAATPEELADRVTEAIELLARP